VATSPWSSPHNTWSARHRYLEWADVWWDGPASWGNAATKIALDRRTPPSAWRRGMKSCSGASSHDPVPKCEGDSIYGRGVVDTDYLYGDTLDKLPDYDRLGDMDIGFGSDTINTAMTEDGKERPEREVIELGLKAIGRSFGCDKLGGWPRSEQGEDIPSDRDGKPMEFVMQVGHEGLLLDQAAKEAIKWPTWGRGQIFMLRNTGEFRYV